MVSIQVTPVGVGVATQASFFVSLHQGSVQTIGSQPITITLTDPAEDQQEKAMGFAGLAIAVGDVHELIGSMESDRKCKAVTRNSTSETLDFLDYRYCMILYTSVYGYVNRIGPLTAPLNFLSPQSPMRSYKYW